MAEDDSFNKYLQDNLTTEAVAEGGTAIPVDSLAQIMQEIIKLDPELKNFVGSEIRTGYMDEESLRRYTFLVWSAYHLLLRGKQFNIPMKTTPKDILFYAKVMASSSTSRNAKLLETLVSQKKESTVRLESQKNRGFLKR
jgi:hypothetical protein